MPGAIKRLADNGGARHIQDKFYTKDAIVLSCLKPIELLLKQSDIVVEPSAGAGAFTKQIKNKKVFAFDINPEHPDILQRNWFDVNRDDIGKGSLLVLGNPPFGVRSDLAKRFIQHSVKLNAESIAFILPKTFSKALNQRKSLFPLEYRLVIENGLDDESFTLEGNSFHIPCRWFVWTKNKSFMPEINLRKSLLPDHPDFIFMTRLSPDADFCLNGNNGKIRNIEDITNPKAEHFIKVADRNKVNSVRDNFNKLEFNFNSSVNGGVAWVGKQEILDAYQKLS